MRTGRGTKIGINHRYSDNAGSVLLLVATEPREQLTRECDRITVSVTARMTEQRVQEV